MCGLQSVLLQMWGLRVCSQFAFCTSGCSLFDWKRKVLQSGTACEFEILIQISLVCHLTENAAMANRRCYFYAKGCNSRFVCVAIYGLLLWFYWEIESNQFVQTLFHPASLSDDDDEKHGSWPEM